MTQTALLTITHDPKGRNIKLFHELQGEFDQIYRELFITISEESSIDLIKEIENSKFNFKVIPKNGVAHARREVVKFGLTGESQFYHYCDFDRILTWGKNYLQELKEGVTDIPNYEYLIFGRTERAMNTHPVEWIETEKITNRIFSMELGKEADITAGSCAFSKASAVFLNKYSKEKMTDAEWPMIISRIANQEVNYSSVDGLLYQEEINGLNQKISDSEKWLSRLKLSLIISESAVNAGK